LSDKLILGDFDCYLRAAAKIDAVIRPGTPWYSPRRSI